MTNWDLLHKIVARAHNKRVAKATRRSRTNQANLKTVRHGRQHRTRVS